MDEGHALKLLFLYLQNEKSKIMEEYYNKIHKYYFYIGKLLGFMNSGFWIPDPEYIGRYNPQKHCKMWQILRSTDLVWFECAARYGG